MIRTMKLSHLSILSVCGLAVALSGCATSGVFDKVETPSLGSTSKSASGTVLGGQYPIGGVYLQIYSVGTNGYGSTAAPLLPTTGPSVVTTNAAGNFNLPDVSTFCPAANPLVYIVAAGGVVIPAVGNTPGTTNNNSALMAALGPCNSILNQNISVNEVTTVASIWALSPYMSGLSNIGSPSSTLGVAGITNAFATVKVLVNTATGASPGPLAATLGGTVSTGTIYSLANAIGYCVNSAGGTAGDSTPCGNLFQNTNPGGTSATAPTDTITAAMRVVQNPGTNVQAIYNGIPPQKVYPGGLASAPNDWTLSVNYAAVLHTPTALALDAAGDVYVSNSANSSYTALNAASSASPASAANISLPGLTSPTSVAVDQSQDVWFTNGGGSTNSIFVLNTTLDPGYTQITGNGISNPSSVAIDGSGTVWVANAGGASLSAFTYNAGTNTATAVSGSPFTGAGLSSPASIAISPK